MKWKMLLLLRLRIFQLLRMMKTVGTFLFVVFLFVSIGILFPLLDNLLSLSSGYSTLFCLALIALIDYSREDKVFLKSVFLSLKYYRFYIMLEYFLISVPVSFYQVIIGQLYNALSIFAACLMIGMASPMITPKQVSNGKKTISFIPVQYFEFKFFIEASGLLWTIFWLAGLASCLHVGIYILWIFVILIIMPEMFKHFESRDMLKWKDNFVSFKFLNYSLFFLKVIAFQTILVTIFHFEYLWLILYFIFSLLVALFMNISIKYEGFTPVFPTGYGQNIVSILTILMILPGGVLIALFYGVWKYFRAESNLKSLYA